MSNTILINAVMALLTDLKELSLEPLTYDGENNDEVDAYHAGYNAALEDMRDIIHKYYTKILRPLDF